MKNKKLGPNCSWRRRREPGRGKRRSRSGSGFWSRRGRRSEMIRSINSGELRVNLDQLSQVRTEMIRSIYPGKIRDDQINKTQVRSEMSRSINSGKKIRDD